MNDSQDRYTEPLPDSSVSLPRATFTQKKLAELWESHIHHEIRASHYKLEFDEKGPVPDCPCPQCKFLKEGIAWKDVMVWCKRAPFPPPIGKHKCKDNAICLAFTDEKYRYECRICGRSWHGRE